MLEVDGERHIYVVDLRSGERNMIEGALWPDVDWPYAELVGSPEGDKLALIQRDATNGSLCHLSVIDFKKMRLFAIERDTKEVGNEHYADWFDNDTIMVDNNVIDETGHNTGDSIRAKVDRKEENSSTYKLAYELISTDGRIAYVDAANGAVVNYDY